MRIIDNTINALNNRLGRFIMLHKRWKWQFSPLIIIVILISCQSDEKPNFTHAAVARHLADYEPPGLHWGFINTAGEIIIESTYDDVRHFSDGLAAVNQKGLWGYIDKKGKYIVPPQYIKAQPFVKQRARVREINGKMGLINTLGDTILKARFDEIYSEASGFMVTELNGKKGVIDRNGRVIISNLYSDLRVLNTDLFAVKNRAHYHIFNSAFDTLQKNILAVRKHRILKTDRGWGVLNATGDWVLPSGQESIVAGHTGCYILIQKENYGLHFTDSKAFKALGPGRIKYLGENRYAQKSFAGWQLLDSIGIKIDGPPYDAIYRFTEGIAAVQKGNWWGYIDLNNRLLIPPMFVLPWKCAEGKLRLFTREGFGYHDQFGQVVIEPKFADVRDFSDGMAAFQD